MDETGWRVSLVKRVLGFVQMDGKSYMLEHSS